MRALLEERGADEEAEEVAAEVVAAEDIILS